MDFNNPYKDAGIAKDDVLTVGINGQDPVLMASKEAEECATALGGTFQKEFWKDQHGGEHFYDKGSGLSEWEWVEEKQKELGTQLTRSTEKERPSNYIYTYDVFDLGEGLGQVYVREDEQEEFNAQAQKQGWMPRKVSTQRWNGVDISGDEEQLNNVFNQFSKDGRLSDDQLRVLGVTEETLEAGKENMARRIEAVNESLKERGEVGFGEYEARKRGLESIGEVADTLGEKVAMYLTEAVNAASIDLYWTPGEIAEHLGGDDGLEKIRNMGLIDRIRIAFTAGLPPDVDVDNPDELWAWARSVKTNKGFTDYEFAHRDESAAARITSGGIDMAKAATEFASASLLAAALGFAAPVTGGASAPAAAAAAAVATGAIYTMAKTVDKFKGQTADRMIFNPATGQLEKISDGRQGLEALGYAVGGAALDYTIERFGGKVAGKLLKPVTKPAKRFATKVLGKEMAAVLGLTPGVVKNWSGGGVIKRSAMKLGQAYHALAHNPWGKVVQSGIRGATPSGILEEMNEEALQAFAEGALNIRGELDLEKGRIASGSFRDAMSSVFEVYKSAPEFAATMMLYNIGTGPVSRGINHAVNYYGNHNTLSQALLWRGYTKSQLKDMNREQIREAFKAEYMTGGAEAKAKVEAEMLERHKTAEGMMTELQKFGMPEGAVMLQNEDGSYTVKTRSEDGTEVELTDPEEIRTWGAARIGDVAGQFGYNAFLTQEQLGKVSNAILFMSRDDLENVSRMLRETGVSKAFEVFGNDPEMVDAMQQALSMQYLSTVRNYANTPTGLLFAKQSNTLFREMAARSLEKGADEVDAAYGEFYRYANGIALEGEAISKTDVRPIFTAEDLRTSGTPRDGGGKTWEKNGILLTQMPDNTFRVRLEDAAHKTVTRSFSTQGDALEYVNTLGAKKAKSDARFNEFKRQAEQIYDSLYNNGQGGQRNMLVLHNAYENAELTKSLRQQYEQSRYYGKVSFDDFLSGVTALRAPNGGLVLFTDNIRTLAGLTSAIRHEGMHTGLKEMFNLESTEGDAGARAFIERVLPIFKDAGDKFILRDHVGDEVDMASFDNYSVAAKSIILDEAMAYLCELMAVKPSLNEKINVIFGETLFKGDKALSGMTPMQRDREVRELIAESFARVHDPKKAALLHQWHESAGMADTRQYAHIDDPVESATYTVPRGSDGDLERKGNNGVLLPPPTEEPAGDSLDERVKQSKEAKKTVRKQAEDVVDEKVKRERKKLNRKKKKAKPAAIQGEVVDTVEIQTEPEQKPEPVEDVITVSVTAEQSVQEYKDKVYALLNSDEDPQIVAAVLNEELQDALLAYAALAGEGGSRLFEEVRLRIQFLNEVVKTFTPALTPPSQMAEEQPVAVTAEEAAKNAAAAKATVEDALVEQHAARQRIIERAKAKWDTFVPAEGATAPAKTIGALSEQETFDLITNAQVQTELGATRGFITDEQFWDYFQRSGAQDAASFLSAIQSLNAEWRKVGAFKRVNGSKAIRETAKKWGLSGENLLEQANKTLGKIQKAVSGVEGVSVADATPARVVAALADYKSNGTKHIVDVGIRFDNLSANQSGILASEILDTLHEKTWRKHSDTDNAKRKRADSKLASQKVTMRLLRTATKDNLTFNLMDNEVAALNVVYSMLTADANRGYEQFVPTALGEWKAFVKTLPQSAIDAIQSAPVDEALLDSYRTRLNEAAGGSRAYSMKFIKDTESSILGALLRRCNELSAFERVVEQIDKDVREDRQTTAFTANYKNILGGGGRARLRSRMQFIGVKGATKEELDGLKVAKQMLRDYGYTAKRLIYSRDTDAIIDINEELFDETGWFVGLDGKWRFETDYIENVFENWSDADRFFSLRDERQRGATSDAENKEMDALADKLKQTKTLLYTLCKDKGLFKRYPALKKVKVEFAEMGVKGGGSYNPETSTIFFNVDPIASIPPYTILVHELQHAIQSIEGFAKGTSSQQMNEAMLAAELYGAGRSFSGKSERLSNKDTSERLAATLTRLIEEAGGTLSAKKAYYLTAGEIESRETESRAELSAVERAHEAPGYFYGVDGRDVSAYQDAIIFFSNDEIDSLITDATAGFGDDEPVDFSDFSIDMQPSPDFSARVSLLESASRGEKPEQLKDVPPSNIMLQISSEERGGFVARGNAVESTLQNIDTQTKKYEYNGEMLSLEELGIKAKTDDDADEVHQRILQGFKTGIMAGDNAISVPYAGMLVDENAPSILARLVHKDAKTVVRYPTVAKILDRLSGWAFGSTNSHNVPREAFDEFLYELDNPIAVYEKRGAFCFVTNLTENRKAPGKNRVVIIVEPMKHKSNNHPLFVVGVDGQVSNVEDDGLYYELKTAFAPEGELGAHVGAIRENLLYVNTERLDGIEFDSRNGVDKKSLPASDILHEVIANIGNAKNTQLLFKNDAKWDPNKVYNKAAREADAKTEAAKTKAKQFKLPEHSNAVGEISNTLNTLIEDGLKEDGGGEDLWIEAALDLVDMADKLPESAAEISAELNAFAESPAFDVDSAKKVLDVINQYDYNSLAARALVSAKVKKLGDDGVEITPSSLLKEINAHQALKAGRLDIKKSQLGHVKAIAQEIADLAFKQNAAASDIRIQFATPIRTDEQFVKYQNRVLAASEALRNFGERSYDKVINAQGPLFRGVNKVLSTLGIKKEEVGDDLNVEASVKNVHGKIRNKVEQIHRQYLDPLRQLMKNHKLDAETLDEYLYAKFAPERNKMIQARTLVVDPNTGELISMDENGSGMSAEEAATINKRFMSDPKREAYDKAMHLVWEMNAKASEMMVKYGLVSNAQRETWRKLSPHYVPLLDLDANHFSRSMKKNLHLNGIPRRAKGRYTKAASPLAGSVYQMQEIIKRGERSNVNKTLAAFIQKYDAEGKVMGGRVLDFAGVTKTVGKGDPMFVPNGSAAESIIRDYNQQENVKATGQEIELVETEDSKELGGKLVASGGIPETLRVKLASSTAGAPNVVEYFEGGNRKFILFDKHNEEAVRIAEAANGTNILVPGAASSLEAPWRLTQRLTRWKADISTTLNPKFVLRNMGADFFNTSMILTTEGKYKELGAFAKNYFKAMKTVRDFAKGKQIGDSELGKYYLEARENGMLTGVYGEGTFKEAAHKLSRDIKRMQGGSFRQGWEGFKEFMETIGSYPEQGARLAVYAAMRKRGMSPAQAAQYGREVTVDFNAKGEWTPVINTLYMFSNAGAQGVARAIKALQTGAADRGGGVQGYVRAAMPGIMVSLALGYLSSMMMDAAGDDDEEDGVNTSKYARLPEHVKANNVAIPFVGDTYIQLPTRGMWQSFTNLGTLIYDFQTGRKDAEEVVAGFTASMRDATDFIGGNAPTAGQWLAPTIFDPLVQVLEGKDWAGREIYRKDFGQGGANAHRGKNATGSLYKMLAEGLNSATGGDKVKSGLIDLYPETYQLFAEFMLGSLAQLALNDVPNTLQTAAGAREAKANDLPAIGGVLRQSSDVESQYYTEFAKFDKVYKELKGYRKERMTAKTAEERQKWRDREQALIAKYPWARSADTLNAIASRITKLKKQTNERNEASIDAQIEKQAKNFLRFIQKGQ